MTAEELESYRSFREMTTKLLVVTQGNIQKYSKPVVLQKRPVMINGHRLSKDEYLGIVHKPSAT